MSDASVCAVSQRKQWKRFTEAEEAEALKRYGEGQTVREIAEWLDHPAGSVYLMLKRLGAEFQPKKESTPTPASKPETKPEPSKDMSVIQKNEGAAEPPKTQLYELETQASLKAVPKSDTLVEIHLANKGPINGIQFSLTGTSITSVRTTSRTTAFMAKFNAANGRVIMISVSQTPIPPGDGPILEVVCEKARTATLSDVKLIKVKAPKM